MKAMNRTPRKYRSTPSKENPLNTQSKKGGMETIENWEDRKEAIVQEVVKDVIQGSNGTMHNMVDGKILTLVSKTDRKLHTLQQELSTK